LSIKDEVALYHITSRWIEKRRYCKVFWRGYVSQVERRLKKEMAEGEGLKKTVETLEKE